MKIVRIVYKKKFSLGNYQTQDFEIEAELSDRFGLFTQVGIDFGGANIGTDFVGQTTEWGAMIGGVTRF